MTAGTVKRALHVAPAGSWPAERAAGRITLPYDDRHRRRLRLTADDGTEFLLDLERAAVLRDGDGLALDDGAWIAVRAAAEDVLEVTAAAPGDLVRLAWHIGNRHIPAELSAGRILIRDDPVIADMLRGLGAVVAPARAPFTPEGGAYAGGVREHRHAHRDHGDGGDHGPDDPDDPDHPHGHGHG